MGTFSCQTEVERRSVVILRSALGKPIEGWLEDPAIVEIMLNPDGRLWIDRLAEGLSDTGERMSAEAGERLLRTIAHHVGAEVTPSSPILSAELPYGGERFDVPSHRSRMVQSPKTEGGGPNWSTASGLDQCCKMNDQMK